MEENTDFVADEHFTNSQDASVVEASEASNYSLGSGYGVTTSGVSPVEPGLYRRPLNVEVMDYYNSFNDVTEPVFSNYERDEILQTHPSDQSKPILNKVISDRESVASAEKTFSLCMEQSQVIREQYNLPQLDLEYDFPQPSTFGQYLTRLRRSYLNKAGWKKISITVDDCHTETAYITPLNLALREMLQKFGGVNELRGFSRSERDGSRCYSSILDSQIMEQDTNVAPIDGKVLYFSLYADGTQLSESGTTEATVFRVRIDNLPKASNVWRTIGMIIRKKDGTASEKTIQRKRKLMQRLVFHIINPVATNPYILESTYCRISSLVCDQPQERDLTCLLRSNTFRNCSMCRNMFGACVEIGHETPLSCASAGNQHMEETLQQPSTPGKRGSSEIPFSSNGSKTELYADENSFDNTPRSVQHTVTAQLELAVLERVLVDGYSAEWPLYLSVINSINGDVASYISSLKEFLRHECAREIPPALVCLPLFGTPPFRFYKSFTYDLLHVVDLGLVRTFADNVHAVIAHRNYRSNVYKSTILSAANRRILSLPSLPRVNRYSPFRTSKEEKQAPFTGNHWRNMVPLLWYALLGLNRQAPPDNDDLFITALSLDRFVSGLRQVNESKSGSFSFTMRHVDSITYYGMECCQSMKNVFDMAETTKQHRTMTHLAEYLKQYGNLLYGDSSTNESLHKGLKKAVHASNMKGSALALQVLQTNCLAEYMEERNDEGENQFYFKDDVITNNSFTSKREEILSSQQSVHAYEKNYEIAGVLCADIDDLSSNIRSDPDNIVQNLVQPSNNVQLRRRYHLIRSASITAYLPLFDINATPVKQLIRNELKQDCYWNYLDAVQYQPVNMHPFSHRPQVMFGMIQAVLNSKPLTSNDSDELCYPVCIIRRMENSAPSAGNKRIVNEFGYKRLKYAEGNSNDIWLDYVPLHNVMRKVCIFPDPKWLMEYHNDLFATYNRRTETRQYRKDIRFFMMKNVRESWRGLPFLGNA